MAKQSSYPAPKPGAFRPSAAAFVAVALASLLGPRPGAADPVAVNFKALFNADVVANDSALGDPDAAQSALDTEGFVFGTQTFFDNVCGGGVFAGGGLPNDGFFEAAGPHPAVQLGFDNESDGDNAYRLDNESDSLAVDVPDLHYEEVHLFATTGNGSSDLTITLNYTSGGPGSEPIVVPDWFDPAPAGGYKLVESRDRVHDDTTNCSDDDGAAIFGLVVPVDPTRILSGMSVERTDDDGVFVLFGAVAIGSRIPTNADISAAWNADVIINDGSGPFDESQSTIDGIDWALITESAASTMGCGPGLPDDGTFAAGTEHPALELGYDNQDDGDNARRSESKEQYSLDVPDGRYDEMHLLATSGGGASELELTLTYSSGSPGDDSATIPDWFEDSGAGVYVLVDGLDRGSTSLPECEDANGAAIFGWITATDPSRILQSVTVEKTDSPGVLNVFGLTLVVHQDVLFADGFDAGDRKAWSTSVPP